MRLLSALSGFSRACGLGLALLVLGSSAYAAEALRGVALVIGQAGYLNLPKLANPANDALAVEDFLNDLGFDTTVRDDRDGAQLKRDLDRFLEDAEEADVAILYYSGHGIEAGGENFLVPVDADLSALDAAGERLVPLSAYLDRLKASVPVAIVMLDACRDNPFPGDATVRLAPDAPPAPIGAAGLGETRSVVALNDGAAKTAAGESFGTVIAFSAEPGKTALDGEPGASSPYAAAVTRHLDAMAGEEFATVMRMVSEEVYLKTAGRQRPWMNESLHRLLYFGQAAQGPTGDEGDILTERRQLLVSIAALPDFDRRQIEGVAASAAVPMDALYGMLRTLGAEAPKDPAELDKLLRSQTGKLKELLAERAALKSADPEIVRLSALADMAVAEGALATALRLHERAKARVGQLEKTIEQAETDIRDRRIEFAEVFARSAQAYALNFNHAKAAEDYGKAFAHVERWDDSLAWSYMRSEVEALADHGEFAGDNAFLLRAIDLSDELDSLARRLGDPAKLASAELNRGIALLVLGEREPGIARLEDAAAAFRRSLELSPRESATYMWAAAQTNIASALGEIAKREPTRERFAQAIEANRAVLSQWTPETSRAGWVVAQINLGRLLYAMSEREPGIERLEESVAAFELAIGAVDRQADPWNWAAATGSLANTLLMIGQRGTGTVDFEKAVDLHRAVLEAIPRDRDPIFWASTQRNLGTTLAELAERTSSAALLREAIAAQRAALEEFQPERSWSDWVSATSNLASTLGRLGEMERSVALLDEAISVGVDLLGKIDRKAAPVFWARQANNTANDATLVTELGGPVTYVEWAEKLLREAVAIQEQQQDRPAIGFTQSSHCSALVALGRARKDRSLIAEGIGECERGVEVKREYGLLDALEDTQRDLDDARAALSQLGGP